MLPPKRPNIVNRIKIRKCPKCILRDWADHVVDNKVVGFNTEINLWILISYTINDPFSKRNHDVKLTR